MKCQTLLHTTIGGQHVLCEDRAVWALTVQNRADATASYEYHVCDGHHEEAREAIASDANVQLLGQRYMLVKGSFLR